MTLKIAVPKRCLALPLAVAALLALPAAGHAATNFGSRLLNEPANAGKCTALGPCTLISFIHPSDPDGDPYSGGSPVDGVITKFRVKVFGEGGVKTRVTLRVANITPNPGNDEVATATPAGTGPTVDVDPGPGPDTAIREFPARLSVARGQHLGLDGPPNLWATYNNSGDKFSYVFAPPLLQGQGARGSSDNAGELLVAATVEPDSDKDGFGDETQDRCPTQGNGGAACSAADRRKPTLSRLRFSRSSFPAQRTGPSLLAQRTFGARILFRLSETATTTFRVQRARTGRRIRGRCRAATRRNKLLSRRRCRRYVRVRGSFKHTDGAGANSLQFTGRVGGRRLRVGRYRLVARATDLAGNKSATKTKRFRIRR